MPTALLPAGLSSSNHQGIGARIVHRLGGALRIAIAGVAHVGRRRPTPPAPAAAPATAEQHPQAPAPTKRPRTPHRRLATAPTPTRRPGWIARWFGRTRPRRATFGRAPFAGSGYTPFTPETHPGLNAEACALLNTPVKDCDPELLRLVLLALARQIADSLPPGLGPTDPQALFSTLWTRLAGPLGEAAPDAAPAEQQDGATDAQPAALMPPDAQPEAQSPILPDSAASANTSVPPKSRWLRNRSHRHGHQVFRDDRRLPDRSRRIAPHLPPPRRLSYAACAGPP